LHDRRISITQGEIAIARGPGVCISTLLGSCVACCLWDPIAGVGGVNHMLLAGRSKTSTISTLMGINELELLINGLIKNGAQRGRIVAKVFGGARMVTGLSEIGLMNGRFTLEYLARESIPCLGHSLGGTSARHLLFWPATGLARQKLVVQAGEPAEMISASPLANSGNDVEIL